MYLDKNCYQSLEYNRILFLKSRIATIIMDLNTRKIIDCNEAAISINRFRNRTELIGKTLFDISVNNLSDSHKIINLFNSYVEKALKDGSYIFEWEFQYPDGGVWQAQIELVGFNYNNKSLLQISIMNITEYKRSQKIAMLTNADLRTSNEQLVATEEELRQQFEELEYIQNQLKIREEMYRNLIEDINCMVYEFDRNRILTYVSPVTKEILGYDADELRGVDYFTLIHPEDKQYLFSRFQGFKEGRERVSEDYRIKTKAGYYKWVRSKTKVTWREDIFIVARGVLFDIHEQKIKEARIDFLSTRDGLTGVYNRSYFEEKLWEFDDLAKALPISIIVADINGLKEVNDKSGQQAGNKLLINAAHIINKLIDKNDIIARIGGDEFAVLLPNRSEEDSEALVVKIKNECKVLEEQGIYLSMSLGVAVKNNINESIHNTMYISEERMYNKKLLESKSTRSHLIESLMNVMSEKTFETKEHCHRLSNLSKKLAEKMHLKDDQIEKLKILSIMHDIGKIAVPEYILSKPGALNNAEWTEMKKHTEIGYRIAKKTPELAIIAEEILSHHERWDGKGYPQGLKGPEIPLESRIIAVVDAFDAMTNDRVYRKAISIEDAIKELINNAGTQFDPFIVDVFVNQVIMKTS